jgi:hypothetical protein
MAESALRATHSTFGYRLGSPSSGDVKLTCLVVASLLMAALGAYQVINEAGRMFR